MDYLKLIRYTLALLLALLGASLTPARAQQPPSVLDRYIDLAVQNNRELISRNLDVREAQAKLSESRSGFYPDIDLQATYDLSEGGRTIDIPAGDLINPTNAAVNNLLGDNSLPTTIKNVSEPILNDQYQETKISITQPLFNTDLFYNYKAQSSLVSAQEARQKAFENELVKQVKVQYYNYLKATELLTIQESTKVLLRELLEYNKDLVKYDKATRDVVSSAKFELNNLESMRAKSIQRRNSARSMFNILLNRPLDTTIKVDSSISSPSAVAALSNLKRTALQSRQELFSLESNIRAQQQLRSLQKGHVLPEVFASGDIGYQGDGYAFNDDQKFWFVRVGLRWDLFQGFENKAKIQQSKIRVQRLENRFETLKDQIRLQVMDAYDGFKAARAELHARGLAVENARERFRIVRNKYRQNQALLVEYLDARTKFTNAKRNRVSAKYDVLARHAELEQSVARY